MDHAGIETSVSPNGILTARVSVFQLTLNVSRRDTGTPITSFKFIVNEDDVGDQSKPNLDNWPSFQYGASHSPVVATGNSDRPTVSLPAGKYLVSILAPDHKPGGDWINLNGDSTLTIGLQPYPLPLSKIRVRVFEDNRPVNGENDIPFERGLAGFRIIISDGAREVTADYAGNPIGTVYELDTYGNPILDPDQNPIPVPGTGGVILTDENGNAVISNLTPGKYKVQAIPPDDGWIQSTTIEGTGTIDVRIEEGDDGYRLCRGFKTPNVCIGFVRPVVFSPGAGTGIITGRVLSVTELKPPLKPLARTTVERPWIALSDTGRNNKQVYTGQGNSDGTFSIPNVPAGFYRMAIWDEPLEHIISFHTVQIHEGETVDMGDIGVPRWFHSSGREASPDEKEATGSGSHDGVPLPGRISGFLLDDVNLEPNLGHINYGRQRGIPHTPVGIRDYTGRLITTVQSDADGFFEVLLPSCTINVPTPFGVAPGMYRIVGNDPGDPDCPNENYNPDYRTERQVFDVYPGKTTYAKVVLNPVTAFVETPDAHFATPPVYSSKEIPRVNSVNRVFVAPDESRRIIIRGNNFGKKRGTVTLSDKPIPVRFWKDTLILVRIPSSFPPGPAQLTVTTSEGLANTSGITIHVLAPGAYQPPVINATPETTIQGAIDSAPSGALVIVSPGVYYESPIIYKNIKLQGMGAGIIRLDGRYFASYRQRWEEKLASIAFDGPREIPRGYVVTVVASEGSFDETFNAQIDGLTITGARSEEGGGIAVNTNCRHLEISNNIVSNNGGGFGGGITIGLPYTGDCKNDVVRIHHNRILNNGGGILAGGVAVFSGAHGYEVDHNEFCGNYSAGCGGGLSHYGLSHCGRIHHNRFLFNTSFSDGGAIFIGGEQPVPPETFSAGSGAVDIYDNIIHANLANANGGGIRLLRTGTHQVNVFNNVITNNVSANLGAELALGDASNVVICHNTVFKNITTFTADTGNGRPHAAGLVSQEHSAVFYAGLLPGVVTTPVHDGGRRMKPETGTAGKTAYGKLRIKSEASCRTIDTFPLSPSDLSARAIYGGGIIITWTNDITNENSFIIERSVMYENRFEEVARVGPHTSEYVDPKVYYWVRHFYRVKSCNAKGISAPSNVAMALPAGLPRRWRIVSSRKSTQNGKKKIDHRFTTEAQRTQRRN
ncbi:MAG: IPT/TIG domain-containing protein [Bacillota bacterium]